MKKKVFFTSVLFTYKTSFQPTEKQIITTDQPNKTLLAAAAANLLSDSGSNYYSLLSDSSNSGNSFSAYQEEELQLDALVLT